MVRAGVQPCVLCMGDTASGSGAPEAPGYEDGSTSVAGTYGSWHYAHASLGFNDRD